MKKRHELFISYSQHDGDAAAALLDLFESSGIRCFLAEKSIAAGVEWDAALREGIWSAERLLVLVTPRSKDSIWVAAEIGAAWVLGKAVIPVMQAVQFSDLVGPIAKYHGRTVETRAQIDALVRELKASAKGAPTSPPRRKPKTVVPGEFREEFTSAAAWSDLLKVGDWSYDPLSTQIVGEGMYRYLLSSLVYGASAFTVDCRLRFLSLRPKNSTDAVNAGIVLGWSVPRTARRYYHLAFSGTHVFFEEIGFSDGDEYFDYRHLSENVPFKLTPNQQYDLKVSVDSGAVRVTCSGQKLLNVDVPPSRIVGRVGLRPWRSTLQCERFDVRENV